MKGDSFDYKKRNMEIWNEVAPRYHKRWAAAACGPFQSTKKLVEHVDVQKGYNALDMACGTGAVTRRLSQKVGKSGRVVAVDTSITSMLHNLLFKAIFGQDYPNLGRLCNMLSITAIKVARRYNTANSNVSFVNSDAENFSFNQRFDVVTCQYALFFFPDAVRALRNMRRNLKRSGRLGISVHGCRDKVPFFDAIYDAVTRFIPDYVPPGTPDLDRYGTKRFLRAEIKRAGFSNISIHEYVFRYSPGKFDDYWTNYTRYVAKPIKEKLSTLDGSRRRELRDMVKENAKKFTGRDGIIRFPWQVLILTAEN